MIERMESAVIRVGAAQTPVIGTAAAGGVPVSAQTILSALFHGMGYVAMDRGGLIFLLDQNIAFLPLDAPPRARAVVHRARDAGRVLRKARRDHPQKKLSLRVNWDLNGVIAALRKHHSSSWITTDLEVVWTQMHRAGTMLTFELYWGEELIAADVVHLIMRCAYVATRFSSRSNEHRALQPGFLLAFVAARALREAGVLLWSLGGVDQSSAMAYKHEIAVTEPGAVFSARFRAVRNLGPIMQTVPGENGAAPTQKPVYCPFPLHSVLVEDITDAHVLSFD